MNLMRRKGKRRTRNCEELLCDLGLGKKAT